MLVCSVVLLGGAMASLAFTTNDAVTIFTAYNSVFQVNGYYPGWWTGAEEIEMAEDAYDNSPTAARQTIVSNACNGFISANGSSWFNSAASHYNEYNDDISWAVIAFARGYLITGNTTFLNVAKNNWDGMYNRAWDTNFMGGGLWWRQSDKASKNACVEGPGTIGACLLYNIYGDTNYLNKAQAIYAWNRRVLFNTTSGAVSDSIGTNGVFNTWASAYNQGTFIGAANFLYRATGLPYYYQDAILTAKYTQNSMSSGGILPQYGGTDSDLYGLDGIFARWMARFAKDQNLWPAYGPWLTTNANAAWSVRNTNNLAWQEWATPLGTNIPTDWGCSAAVVVMQVADTSPLDALQATPTAGFTVASQRSQPPIATSINLVLTNTSATAFNWSLANTSAWLNVSSSGGTLSAAGVTNVTVSLIPSATTNLPGGRYITSVNLTNLTSGIIASRLFTLAISGGDAPIMMTGYNAGVLAPNTATSGSPKATGFDIANNYCFYQAGLNGSMRGLPPDGVFTSQLDATTVFQLLPYGVINALLMGSTYPNPGTLTLATPCAYNSISILASSASGGGLGTFVLNYTNGTHSQTFNFNAQDWFNTTSNVAIQAMGRLKFSNFTFDDSSASNPNMYQTTVNLALLGINQAIASITFTKPAASADTGVFAVSGTVMPAAPTMVLQPTSLTNNLPAQGAAFDALASGAVPLSYQWYFSTNGNAGTFAPMVSQINTNLVLNPVLQTTNAGSYLVVITNSFGSVTSSVANLAVYRAPVITQQPAPTNVFVYTGATNAWSVAATAALPVNYYWCMNGATIPAATTPTFQLGNLQTTNSGNYSVVVSNAFGAVTSSIVSLTVVAPSPYTATLLTNNPVAFWELNETNNPATGTAIAYDYVGGFNGTYGTVAKNGNALYNIAGPRPPSFGGFATNNTALQPTVNYTNSGVGVPALNLNNTNVTIVAWIYPLNNQAVSSAIFINRTAGTTAGLSYRGTLVNGAYPLGYVWNDNDSATYGWTGSGVVPPINQWSMVALTITASNATVNCWSATGVQQGTFVHAHTNMTFNGTTYIGTDSAYATKSFQGNIDNVTVFNHAVSSNALQSLYSAGANRAPVFLANPFTLPGITAGQACTGTVATNANDPNGDTMTFGKVSGPAWLSVGGDGSVGGTPLSGDVGTNNFVVSATDAGDLTNTAVMNLTVTAAPPIVTSAVMQGSNLQLNWAGGIGPYQVQWTTNLASPVWQNVGAPISASSLLLSPTNGAAFYRISGQ